jgi:hypothetical protein
MREATSKPSVMDWLRLADIAMGDEYPLKFSVKK